MRNLKLLNKKYLSVILFSLFFGCELQSQEPVDIWNVESENKIEKTSTVENNNNKKIISQNTIYEMQSKKLTN